MEERVEVVVVGAGPTGLALGCTLRRAGVDVLVLNAAAEGANTSRAAVLHARTLEVLEPLDVTPRLLAEGCVVPVFTVRTGGRVLARVDFAGLPTPYPYTLMLPQSRTEALLAGRLVELGGQVHRRHTVTYVQADACAATVYVTGPTGEFRQVHGSYVVGADGMHSTVRGAAGIGFTGGRYPQSFVLADVGLDWPLPPDEVQLFLASQGLVVVAPLPGGHHRVVATADTAPENADEPYVQALLDQRGPGRARVREVLWSSQFQVHHRVADTYRAGPLLLAGDAAHVHSPAGGQGMNTGIQDAVDLGATLTQVLRQGAPPTALDGYTRRRRPVAQRIVTLTDRATRAATLTSPTARAARNIALSLASRLPIAQQRLARQLAELPADR
jgi:2-polyprenyl-6-methoxyphenol hydroxylase-like FAD-dependent oxidoreductase